MPIHKQLRQRPLHRATSYSSKKPTVSASSTESDEEFERVVHRHSLSSAVSASSSSSSTTAAASMEEDTREETTSPIPSNVAVAFQPLYLLAEYALHETMQHNENTPGGAPEAEENTLSSSAPTLRQEENDMVAAARRSHPAENDSRGIRTKACLSQESLLPSPPQDEFRTASSASLPKTQKQSGRGGDPCRKTKKPGRKKGAPRKKKPREISREPDLDLTKPPDIDLTKPPDLDLTQPAPPEIPISSLLMPSAASRKRPAVKKARKAPAKRAKKARKSPTTAAAAKSKKKTKKGPQKASTKQKTPEADETPTTFDTQTNEKATKETSKVQKEIPEIVSASAKVTESKVTKPPSGDDGANENPVTEHQSDKVVSSEYVVEQGKSETETTENVEKVVSTDQTPTEETLQSEASAKDKAEQTLESETSTKEKADKVDDKSQPIKNDELETPKETAPPPAPETCCARRVSASEENPAAQRDDDDVSQDKSENNRQRRHKHGGNSVVSEDSEPDSQDAVPDSVEYSKGTCVKKFFEDRGCWLLGKIVDYGKKENSVTCCVRFDSEEGHETEEMNIGDKDLLSKMVRMAQVCPGTRLAIFWPADEMYYPATVLQERGQNCKAFFVKYDDGLHEWINLWSHEFQLLSEDEDPALANRRRLRSRPGPRRRKSADDALDVAKRSKGGKGAEREDSLEDGDSDTRRAFAKRKRREVQNLSNWLASPLRAKRKRRAVCRWGIEDNMSDKERRVWLRDATSNDSDDEDSDDDFEVSSPTESRRKVGRPKKTPINNVFKETDGREKKSRNWVSKSEKTKRRSLEDDEESVTETELSEIPIDRGFGKGADLVDSDDEEARKKRDVTRVADVSVGVRVSIFWAGDEKFYTGTVTKHRSGKKPFFVEYDDGDSEWIDLGQHTFRIVQRGRKQLKPYTPPSKSAASSGEDTVVRTKNPTKNRGSAPSSPSASKRKSSPGKSRKTVPTSSHTENNSDDVAKINVGTRVSVWWPEDRRYYKGVVTRIQPEANWRPFFLEYDDGDEEWIDFRHHKFRLLAADEEDEPASPTARKLESSADASHVWIGSRLSVWWPEEKAYFDCTVTRYRDHKRSFYLEYDDGDREWIDLYDTNFFVLNASPRRRRKSS